MNSDREDEGENEDLIFLTEKDYEFFCLLPEDEKILCLFDLIINPLEENEDSIKDIVDMSIKDINTANVVVTPNMLIINANSYGLVKMAAQKFFESGLIMNRQILTDSGKEVFQRQKYCNVYEIVGSAYPILMN